MTTCVIGNYLNMYSSLYKTQYARQSSDNHCTHTYFLFSSNIDVLFYRAEESKTDKDREDTKEENGEDGVKDLQILDQQVLCDSP